MSKEMTIGNTKIKSLYQSLRVFLYDVLDDHRTRVVAKKAVRYYIGYWGRSLYFFLGVQVIITALLVMANRIIP